MPNHTIVPNGSLDFNDETAERHTRMVSEYIKRGSLPPRFLAKRLRKNRYRTFSQFLKATVVEATYDFYEPIVWLKKGLLHLVKLIRKS